jgi:hypothetical protein
MYQDENQTNYCLKQLVNNYLFFNSKFINKNNEFDKVGFKGNLFAINVNKKLNKEEYNKLKDLESSIIKNPSNDNSDDVIEYITTLLKKCGYTKQAMKSLYIIQYLASLYSIEKEELEEKIENYREALNLIKEKSILLTYKEVIELKPRDHYFKDRREIDNFLAKYYYIYYLNDELMNNDIIDLFTKGSKMIPTFLNESYFNKNTKWDDEKKKFLYDLFEGKLDEFLSPLFDFKIFPYQILLSELYNDIGYKEKFSGVKNTYDLAFMESFSSFRLNRFEKEIYLMLGENEIYEDALLSLDEGDYFRALALFKLILHYKDSKIRIKYCKNIIKSKESSEALNKLKGGDLLIFKAQQEKYNNWQANRFISLTMVILGFLHLCVSIFLFIFKHDQLGETVGFLCLLIGLCLIIFSTDYFEGWIDKK